MALEMSINDHSISGSAPGDEFCITRLADGDLVVCDAMRNIEIRIPQRLRDAFVSAVVTCANSKCWERWADG